MSLFSLIAVFILVLLTSKSCQDQLQAVEMFKSVNELVDNASKLPMEKQNAKKMFEQVKPNLFGIVCNVKIESAKIGENLQKIHENFCRQLKEGKSIEEIAQNMKKTVVNTEIATINLEIFEKMPQKIKKLPFLDGTSKEMLRAFVGHLLVGNNFLTKLATHIKNVITNKSNNTNKKCSAKNRGRRTKRGDDLECGDCDDCGDCDFCCCCCIGGSSTNNDNDCCCCNAKCCFVLWLIIALACVGGIALCAIKMHQITANEPNAHHSIGHFIGGTVGAGIFLVISVIAMVISCCVIRDS